MASEPAVARAAMVREQLERRGITDRRVLAAMAAVPRELFVRDSDQRRAYTDRALEIDCSQTISQPWIVAAICQGLELEGDESVLEIGTGSGYSAAILSHLCSNLISIERHEALADGARAALDAAGVGAVDVRVGDGSLGAAADGPFDAIAVHAAVPAPPRALLDQLTEGGRLVAPVVSGSEEVLTRFERRGRGSKGDPVFRRRRLAPCRFVPLIGAEGFSED